MKKYRNIYDKRSGHLPAFLFEPISLLLQHINERVNLRRLGNNNRLTYERNKMTITELKQCIDCYGKEIYGFCRHITGNLQDGEDLYQDTFLKAVELADKIDINQNPKSYLISIAVRLWKNRSRKRAWRQRIAPEESIDTQMELIDNAAMNEIKTPEAKTPETEVLISEQNAFVSKCVREEEKYRLPIYLYYSAELSVKEIAECMKLPQGTVKSRLHKARIIIKEKLEVAGYDR